MWKGVPRIGSSASVVNISTFVGPSSGFPSCINTVSDKLNHERLFISAFVTGRFSGFGNMYNRQRITQEPCGGEDIKDSEV